MGREARIDRKTRIVKGGRKRVTLLQYGRGLSASHSGGDYFEGMDLVDAVQGRKPPTVGIHEAMDMTLPGLVSQKSIRRGGEWLEVPDSRAW